MKDKQSLNNIFGSKFFDSNKIMKDVKSEKVYSIILTEHQQKYLDRFSFIPDERKIQYNRSLTSIQLLYYYNEFKMLIESGCTKSFILHDFELLKQEIKRRLNVYDNIRLEFENSKCPIELIYRDWKEIDK